MNYNRIAAAIMLFATFSAAHAQERDPGYAAYRRVVLGDTSVTHAQASAAPVDSASRTPSAPLKLTSYELYQRSVLGWSLDEILRERQRDADLVAHRGMSGESR